MAVSFNKSGIVEAMPTSSDISFILIDENSIELSDESGNILTDCLLSTIDVSHGFIEGFEMMSIFNTGTITCRELIEW